MVDVSGPVTVDVGGVLERIDRLHRTLGTGGIAFDGDGTLWSGDVGEDAYLYAIRNRRLRDDARAPLRRVAEANGLDGHGTTADLASRIHDAWTARRFPDDSVCEVMAWCYAGLTPAEMSGIAEDALAAADLAARLHGPTTAVVEHARAAGLATFVVSASPRAVVEAAAARLGFAANEVVAATTAIEGGRIAPRLASPLPFGPGKAAAGRSWLGGTPWVATFGDSLFDLEMLRAAALGVAVHPEPALRKRLDGRDAVLRCCENGKTGANTGSSAVA